MCLLLGAISLSAQSQRLSESEKQEQYKQNIREKLQLDYSMPDYSTSSINAKVIGQRLAMILENILENYQQPVNLGALSFIQSNQVEDLNYGLVKSMKLGNVSKKGNEITVVFKTKLEPNGLNLKRSQISFGFVDGVSKDTATNDFFTDICRYIKE